MSAPNNLDNATTALGAEGYTSQERHHHGGGTTEKRLAVRLEQLFRFFPPTHTNADLEPQRNELATGHDSPVQKWTMETSDRGVRLEVPGQEDEGACDSRGTYHRVEA